MDWKDIGRRIRKKRLSHGWKQEELAEKAGLSSSYIGMIERGEKMPSLETFIAIANALEVSSDELLAGVLKKGYEIRMSEYTEKIRELNRKNRKIVYSVIDVLIENIQS